MDVSMSGCNERCRASDSKEALARARPVAFASDAFAAATSACCRRDDEVVAQAAHAGPAIMRAVRGALDRYCGIAAALPPEGGRSPVAASPAGTSAGRRGKNGA